MQLTDKQDKFVKALLSGKTQKAAYREAYPLSKHWKDTTVDVKASVLIRKKHVKAHYDKLKKEMDEEFKRKNLWDREKAAQALKWLIAEAQKDIKMKGMRQANTSAFINALKELNAVEGVGAEKEVNIKLIKARTNVLTNDNVEIEDTEELDNEIFGQEENNSV